MNKDDVPLVTRIEELCQIHVPTLPFILICSVLQLVSER